MIWFLFNSENAFLSVAVTFETVGGGGGCSLLIISKFITTGLEIYEQNFWCSGLQSYCLQTVALFMFLGAMALYCTQYCMTRTRLSLKRRHWLLCQCYSCWRQQKLSAEFLHEVCDEPQ